ncbi:MAG TPA: ribosome maturation factor RimP [Bacillota bacterium]|nr:ribosome maturation factor RimP [Bacillota bacterium]
MDVRAIELQVGAMAAPIAERMGLRLLDVEFSSEGQNWYLRLYIEKDAGVGIEDCAALSEAVDAELDRADPIPDAYILEVTSSGEKPIRFTEEYSRFTGRNVLLSTYKHINGSKRHEGTLMGLKDGIVTIEDEEGNRSEIPLEMISKARLAARY